MTVQQANKFTVKLPQPETLYGWALATDQIHNHAIHIVGFEFDGTACFRKGTRFGPNALRSISEDIESYSPYLDGDLEEIRFYDLGNLPTENDPPADDRNQSVDDVENIEKITSQWRSMTTTFEQLFATTELRKQGVKIITLGGEHSISYGPLKTYLHQYPDLVLLHLDAHADLRDGYLGHHYSHASIIRRTLDCFGPGHQLIQYGIRSGTKEEYQWMKANNTLRQSRSEFLQSVAEIAADRPIYLTLDLDYFDPAFLPGTGTPEPGGEDFHSFISLCKILQSKNFVGCDVVELSPPIDATGNSNVFAAKIVRELIICLHHEKA